MFSLKIKHAINIRIYGKAEEPIGNIKQRSTKSNLVKIKKKKICKTEIMIINIAFSNKTVAIK